MICHNERATRKKYQHPTSDENELNLSQLQARSHEEASEKDEHT